MLIPATQGTYAIVLLVAAVCLWLYFRLLPKPIPGIPYSKVSARRILGDLPDALKWRKRTGETWSFVRARSLELESPIFQMFMRVPYGKPWVVITDFRESHDIQASRQGEFDRSSFLADVFGPLLPGNHVWMPSNDQFRAQRNLMRDTMSPAFLHKVVAPAIHTTTLDLIHLWGEKARLAKGRPFESGKDLVRSVVDLILLATFGNRTNLSKDQFELLSQLRELDHPTGEGLPVQFPVAKEPPTYTAIRTLVDSIQIGMNSPAPKQHMKFALNYYPSLVTARKHTDQLMDEVLGSAWKKFYDQDNETNEVTCATELVVQREAVLAKKQNRSVMENSRAIRDELFGFYLAGHETTSTTLCWAVKRLSQHQDIQAKLRASLRYAYKEAVDQGRLPSPEEIVRTSVPYLDAFIEENHRLCTTIPAVIRRTTREAVVFGYTIPKDTDVFMISNGPGYQLPEFAVDESKRSKTSQSSKCRYGSWKADSIGVFDPERFLVKDAKGDTKFDALAGPVLPYGAGLRGCFGVRLAVLELRVIMTMLVWEFKFEETPPELSAFDAHDVNTHRARNTYIRLVAAEK